MKNLAILKIYIFHRYIIDSIRIAFNIAFDNSYLLGYFLGGLSLHLHHLIA